MDPLRLAWRCFFLIEDGVLQTPGALVVPIVFLGAIFTGTNGRDMPVFFRGGGANGRTFFRWRLSGVDGALYAASLANATEPETETEDEEEGEDEEEEEDMVVLWQRFSIVPRL